MKQSFALSLSVLFNNTQHISLTVPDWNKLP